MPPRSSGCVFTDPLRRVTGSDRVVVAVVVVTLLLCRRRGAGALQATIRWSSRRGGAVSRHSPRRKRGPPPHSLDHGSRTNRPQLVSRGRRARTHSVWYAP